MKMRTAYVIHYLPNDPVERAKRKRAHFEQINYWLAYNFKFVIAASNLLEEDIFYHEDIRYIHTPRVGIANSRNMLLREFYASDEDFGLFMDDDVILNDAYGSGGIVEEFIDMDIARMRGIDLFSPIHPVWHGAAECQKANLDLYAGFKFERNPRVAGHAMFLRNMRKFYDREYYFKNEWAPQPWVERCGEDVVFGLDLHMDGFGVFDCYNMIKVVENDETSTWLSDSGKREQMILEFNARLVEEYDLPIKIGCEPDWQAIADNHPLSRKG